MPESCFGKVVLYGPEPLGCLLSRGGAGSVHLYICRDERPQQPRPHRSLVVGAVAFEWATRVASSILRIARGEAAQPVRGQQMLPHLLDDTFRSLRRQHAVRQAYSENLIGTNRWVRRGAVRNVVQAASILVPEEAIKTPTRHRRHIAIPLRASFVFELLRKVFHDSQRVVPERLNLHGFSAARCNYPIANLGVHPCELNTGFAGCKQSAGVHFYSVPCAAHMPGDDVGENRIKFLADEVRVTAVREIRPGSFKEP